MGLLAGCGGNNTTTLSADKPPTHPDGQKISVVTTIFPLYDFTKNIAGDRADVQNLVPPGSEPHNWEPTPKEMVNITKAGLFVYTGANLESWVDKMLDSIDAPNMVVVNASKNIAILSMAPGAEEHEHHKESPDHESDLKKEEVSNGSEHEHEHEHEHDGSVDPHIWVDPVNAKSIVDNILAGMIAVDPANSDYYTANASAYKAKLDQLDADYKTALAGAKGKEFITSHAAFGYLAQRYGIEQVSVRGLSPEAEPTPSRMAEVINTVKQHGIKYIFFESLVSPKLSETIARDTGAKTLVLNPVGGLTGEELAAGKDYISVMRENLNNLKIAFGVNE
jgi:zinc transport system substrate-binding protein